MMSYQTRPEPHRRMVSCLQSWGGDHITGAGKIDLIFSGTKVAHSFFIPRLVQGRGGASFMSAGQIGDHRPSGHSLSDP